MEIKFKTAEEKAAYYRLLFEILLALSKSPDNKVAIANTERLFYMAPVNK